MRNRIEEIRSVLNTARQATFIALTSAMVGK